MSDEHISATVDAEIAARRFARRFDADPAGAAAEFREMLARKGQPWRILQQLNRLDRHDAVIALGEAVPPDAKTHEQIIAEIARAHAQSGAVARAEDLLARASAARRSDYNFQFAAGRVLAEVRRHAEALAYFEAAVALKPTQQAAERAFLTQLALGDHAKAASGMGRILRAGTYRDAMARDFAFLLGRIERGGLDPALADALSHLPSCDAAVGSALTPHLVAQDMMDNVVSVIDRDAGNFGGWDEDALLDLVDYLARQRRMDQILRIADHYDGGSAAVSAALARVLDAMPIEEKTQYLIPQLDAGEWREIARRFAKTADPKDALEMLRLIPALVAGGDKQGFYAREKTRLSRLAAYAVDKLGRRDDALEALVAVALHFVDAGTREFFSSPGLAELAATLAAARRLDDAPETSRLGLLREGYFAFHLERRTGLAPDELANDIAFCEAVFDYFYTLSHWRPAASVPVGRALATRTGRKALALDDGLALDVLTDWGFMQARPAFSLAPPVPYDVFRNWYLNVFFAQRAMAPGCLNAALVAHLNETVLADAIAGAGVTRYLKLMLRMGDSRRAFDLGSIFDRMLFVLSLIAGPLARHAHLQPFFRPFLGKQDSVLAKLIRALGGAALLDDTPVPAARVQALRNILLVGHASKQTGLGRNFAMLAKGFETAGLAVTGLDFEAPAEAFDAELKRWRESQGERAIAVLAVNAHDVPEIFVKDRDFVLAGCHACGFYLWEVSRVPRVQALGVALVDEIWAPTRYVADIYAPLKQTHVVGKGLFLGDEPYLLRQKRAGANARFTFATVFDFDSSIERKNPLGTALAFAKAFAGDEKVELVIKTSNVNPHHWSNTARQWERLSDLAAKDRRIKLVTRRYSDEEMTALVSGADCIVSLHRSEGFGYLISDAMAFGVPVIATAYSGNADFTTPETAFPVAYKTVDVPARSARWHCEGATWADPDIADAASAMRAVFEDYPAALAKAAHARENIVSRYSMAAFAKALAARVDAIVGSGKSG